jgi:ATP-dependent protease ClpP protease subunit
MAEGHITVYGEIIPWQDSEADDYGAVNLRNIQDQLQAQDDATELVVHIHSNGGDVDEGFAIHDALIASGKPITTLIEGLCASSATIIAMAGSTRKMTENSEFMIHLPFGGQFGTAEDMQKAAALLEKYENKVLDLYVSVTGGDPEDEAYREKIYNMMKEETYLSSESALAMKFITEVMPSMRAVAKISTHKLNTTMSDKKIEELIDKKVDGFWAKMKKLFTDGIKMLTVTTGDGTILDFGDAISEESEIAVGLSATVDGSPAEGEYVLTDGRTLVFEAGAITEIKEAEGGETVEDLKAQLAEKDKKIEELEAAQNSTEEAVVKMKKDLSTEIEKQMKEFKATMLSDSGKIEGKPNPDGNPGEPQSRKLRKDKD